MLQLSYFGLARRPQAHGMAISILLVGKKKLFVSAFANCPRCLMWDACIPSLERPWWYCLPADTSCTLFRLHECTSSNMLSVHVLAYAEKFVRVVVRCLGGTQCAATKYNDPIMISKSLRCIVLSKAFVASYLLGRWAVHTNHSNR